uniref:Genetic suppressor element-like domain-containing protein n=1 Tax=Timema douglasi TaxID=61478 RepID=A0A7R8VGC5_TIMDO|nr:unnamed protein product [Timema douglasi]
MELASLNAQKRQKNTTEGRSKSKSALQMDLAETMKNIVAKGIQTEMGPPGFPGTGYVTEKLYMLLQLYLQNKGWNPSVELLQCFTELKEASMLPSAAYLQMMASRVALDGQGRLILRETGKIILPYEHFANAVMLKHMNGPHGLHLGLEGTIRAVMESYTIGRECFGMEKEFIVEVVQNCPNPACRYYKNTLVELSQKSLEMSHKSLQQHMSGAPTYIPESTAPDASNLLRGGSSGYPSTPEFTLPLPHPLHHPPGGPVDLTGLNPPANDKQRTSEKLQQQQHRNMPTQPSSHDHKMGGGGGKMSGAMASVVSQAQPPPPQYEPPQPQQQQQQQQPPQIPDHKLADFLRANLENLDGLSSANKDLLALHNGAWTNSSSNNNNNNNISGTGEGDKRGVTNNEVGQEKIVRAFAEVMKNMSRMKTCVRPAMCKPYGKQSESLQKTLVDTIQLVQSLRSFLPPPHIAVSSWKNEDKHSYLPFYSLFVSQEERDGGVVRSGEEDGMILPHRSGGGEP